VAITCYDEMRPGQAAPSEYLDNRVVDGPLNDAESYYTGQQREWLASWLRVCADRLLLNHWTLRLWHEPPDEDAHASTTITDGRVFASFRFDNEIFEADPLDARLHMAHELVHLLLDPMLQMVEHDLKGVLGDQALVVFRRPFRRELELAVDHLAGVVAPGLPMPPWTNLNAQARTAKSNTTAQDKYREDKGPSAPMLTSPGGPTTYTSASGFTITQNSTTGTHPPPPPPDAEQPPAE
jgi:hypothetical protein